MSDKLSESDVRNWLGDDATLSDYATAPFRSLSSYVNDTHPVKRHAWGCALYGIVAVGLLFASNYVYGGWAFSQLALILSALFLAGSSFYSVGRIIQGSFYDISDGAEFLATGSAVLGSAAVGIFLIGSFLFPGYNDFHQAEAHLLPQVQKYQAAITTARQNDQTISLGSLVANGHLPASTCSATIIRHDETVRCGIGGDQQFEIDYGPEDAMVAFGEADRGLLMRIGDLSREDYSVLKRKLERHRSEVDNPTVQFRATDYRNDAGYFLLPERAEKENLQEKTGS